jgi:hypothetical protein
VSQSSSTSAPAAIAQRGQRVRLLKLGVPAEPGSQPPPDAGLVPGDEGTVLFTDSLGTTHIDWDSGGQFGLIPGQDEWEAAAGHEPGPPAAALLETVRQTISDLVEVAQRLPALGSPGDAGATARIMDWLSEECAGEAAAIRALPGRPQERPGYTFAAAAAVLTAAEAEHDFGSWLAGVLCQAAAHLGSSDHLVLGRSGSWEAGHILALVRNTAGYRDEHLPAYRDGAPQ